MRPCNILEYVGKTTQETVMKTSDEVTIAYGFAQPEMTVEYKERLVFDEVGIIGSVGGTLGMCIGFSFSGITSTLLEFITSKIQLYF